jgi:hypothetical protein
VTLFRPVVPPGGATFASRTVHRLRYACQGETPAQRTARRARKLRQKLGDPRPVLGSSLPAQPPRIVEAIRAAENRALPRVRPRMNG